MEILLANPRGFCAGVERAVDIVKRALELFGAPIYVRHEVVHNRYVIRELRERGAFFVEDLAQVPDGAIVVFSAHGVSRAVREEALRRGLRVFDATCPLVTKVHMEVASHARRGNDVVLIGHAGHPEVQGTMGQFDTSRGGRIHLVQTVADVAQLEIRDASRLAFVTQTTLSTDDTQRIIRALRERFPSVAAPRRDDICYATQNRQDAVKALAARSDLVLVVGSRNSSNSNRLKEIAQSLGRAAYLVDGPEQLQRGWFAGVARVGITAGASAPGVLVDRVVRRLREWGAGEARELGGELENVYFALPKVLRPA